MERLFRQVVRHKKTVVAAVLVIAATCAVLRGKVGVNYSMTDYLPEDSASTISLDVMEQEFDGAIPNARIMVRDVSRAEAIQIKKQLKQCTGVTDVTWLDDMVSPIIPTAVLPDDTVETYYKDGNALYSVTIDEDQRSEAVKELREVIGDDNAMTGDMVSTAIATESTVNEIRSISIGAVLFVLLVLILTLTSWVEPILVLFGLGVAIIINAGSNLIFGEISFVTNAAGSILQLAVSLDYSVFLIHRFEQCRKEHDSVEDAMVAALCESVGSIASSGLTTVIGFLALAFMRFRLGPDLGFALAKGVGISLLIVFFFFPCVLLLAQKWVEKTRHRSWMPSFRKLGRTVCRMMIPCALILALLVVPSYVISNRNSFYYGSSHIFGTNTQLGRDTQAIEDAFGKQDTYVVLVPKGDLQQEKKLSQALHDIPEVKSILSRVDYVGPAVPSAFLEGDVLSKLESNHYTRMVVTVDAEVDSDETFALVRQVRKTIAKYYPKESYLAGQGVSTCDLMLTTTADMKKVNGIAIAAVFLVLLFTLRSLPLPVFLVLSIETATWINLSLPYVRGTIVFYISYLIISSVQLGATVDYAILYTSHYMENRQKMGRRESIAQTTQTVTVSILTSGSALAVVGFLLGFFSTHGILKQLGMFLGIGSVLSVGIVLFALPGLLYVFDGLIRRLTKNANFVADSERTYK